MIEHEILNEEGEELALVQGHKGIMNDDGYVNIRFPGNPHVELDLTPEQAKRLHDSIGHAEEFSRVPMNQEQN